MIERMKRPQPAAWGILAVALTALAVFGIFLVAPEDAIQGPTQRIFYFHVSIAIVSYVAFGVGAVAAILYLRRRDERFDDISSIAIGLGLLFSFLTLVTGSIWAKAGWGQWWVWTDMRLLTSLLIVLLYLAYFMLRSSAEPDRIMRSSALFAVIAFASVPISFISVRVARSFVHPVLFTRDGANMPGSMLIWFVVSLAAMTAVFIALLQLEIIQRRADRALSRLKLALEAA